MRINQLEPGHSILETTDSGEEIRFEVINVKPLGRRYEVTMRTSAGLESVVYPGNAYVQTAA
ncbi:MULTISPECIES: hypothetical protein [Vogesella]|jgi:hypothetical protein|uniref:Uncharacterized protein n=2 Tax=Vogesella TaxID=57739 RepID=A0A495BAP3_VOGIN|nr:MULTISPECIES: hypothetical protein [Vogesella]KMJ52757.1 hypothetical protein ACG97_11835 [Vogesella sp. EB]MCQ4143371.1 hypothetical protein [Vogesella sp. AC12]MDC7690713.1 hypothetical protein [Vogesella indigofera]MDC7696445.1 hypothetical protein [Vogesella indigofera]MDC7699759.1 hypothetical protein [Vogesella indigofera]